MTQRIVSNNDQVKLGLTILTCVLAAYAVGCGSVQTLTLAELHQDPTLHATVQTHDGRQLFFDRGMFTVRRANDSTYVLDGLAEDRSPASGAQRRNMQVTLTENEIRSIEKYKLTIPYETILGISALALMLFAFADFKVVPF